MQFANNANASANTSNPYPTLIVQKGYRPLIAAMAFSSDGKLLATQQNDVIIWEVSSGKQVRRLKGPAAGIAISGVTFIGKSYSLLAHNSDRCFIWPSGPFKSNQNKEIDLGVKGLIDRVAVASQSRNIFVCYRAKNISPNMPLRRIEVFNEFGKFLHSLDADNLGAIRALSVSPTGEWFVVAIEDGKRIFRIDAAKGTSKELFEAGKLSIEKIALAGDGRLLTCVCASGKAEIRRSIDGKLMHSLLPKTSNHSVISNNGRFLLRSEKNSGVIYDLQNGFKKLDQIHSMFTETDNAAAINQTYRSAICDDAKSVCHSAYDRELCWWKLPESSPTLTSPILRPVDACFTGSGLRVLLDKRHLTLASQDDDYARQDQSVATRELRSWDFQSGRPITSNRKIVCAFSKDGRHLARRAEGKPDQVVIEDVDSGNEIAGPFPVPGHVLNRFQLVPAKRLLLLEGIAQRVLWQYGTRQKIWEFSKGLFPNSSWTLTSDGNYLVYPSLPKGTFQVVALVSEKPSTDYFLNHTGVSHSVVSVPNGKDVISVSSFEIFRWDPSRPESAQLLAKGTFSPPIAISDDGKRLLVHTGNQQLDIFDSQTGDSVDKIELQGQQNGPVDVKFFPGENSRFISIDGESVFIGRMKLPESQVRIFHLSGERWAVAGVEGAFDTSDIDSVPGFLWTFPDNPLQVFEPEAFARILFRPQLLAERIWDEILHLNVETTDNGNPLASLYDLNRAYPEVDLKIIQKGPVTIARVTVSGNRAKVWRNAEWGEESSGAYDLRVFRNGQLVSQLSATVLGGEPDGRDCSTEDWPKQDSSFKVCDSDGKKSIDVSIRLPLAESNKSIEISAYAFNSDRVRSAVARVNTSTGIVKQRVPRRAYLVTFGANAFENSNWNLHYADNDAKEVGSAFQSGLKQTGVFKNPIHVPLLSSWEGTKANFKLSEKTATKSNLEAVLSLLSGSRWPDLEKSNRTSLPKEAMSLKRATPDDLVVLFVSSHGYTDAKGQFYFLPYDIGKNSPEQIDVNDPAKMSQLLAQCVSSCLLSKWLNHVDAGDIVLILDTCEAAGSVAPPGFKHGPFGNAGLGQLAYDKGTNDTSFQCRISPSSFKLFGRLSVAKSDKQLGKIVSGAGGRYPNELWGRTPL